MIQVCTVGGFSEIGRNMTAVKYRDTAVIIDMGLHMENYINFDIEEELEYLTPFELKEAGAIPDDSHIDDWARNVKAIILSHAHLDHLGAVPFLAAKYDAEIVCSAYTAQVLGAITRENDTPLPNRIRVLRNNARYKISGDMEIEFISVTHSTPDTVIVVIHTPKGSVMYANDFKFDNNPVLGDKPNYRRLKELGKHGKISLLIEESLNAGRMGRTPSETVAREMLREVLIERPTRDNGIIVTTFSSHIARLKTIVELGQKLRRKIVFLGRSLAKYTSAAEELKIASFSKHAKICAYPSQIKKQLREIEKQGRDKYLIVVTGHQGEPDAVLSKIVSGKLDFRIFPEDSVIFSCNTIPSPTNLENRARLEEKLVSLKARIFKDVHSSGHASREDHRDLIEMVKPKHIIPSHAGEEKSLELIELAQELGYRKGKNVHLMSNGRRIEI